MKNHFLRSSLFVLFGLLVAFPSFAQTHIIKWRPLKLVNPVTRGASFGYEGVVGQQISMNMGVKVLLPRDLSGAELTFKDVNDIQTGTGLIDAGSLKGFTLTPEFRIYFSQKDGAPYGFYLAPWLRYFNYNADPIITHLNNQGEASQLDTRFAFSGLGAGGSLGFQHIWDSGFMIEWNIGAGVSGSRARFTGTVSGQIEDDIDQFLDNLSTNLGGVPINFLRRLTNDGTELNARTPPFPWPIIKSELAIGFAF